MIIEAFACAVPVLGSDSGEIPYVIGDAGLVAKEGDEAAWNAAISLLVEDSARRRELGQKGLERARSAYAA